MKTPTLVLAVILAMAVVGDTANLEKILSQLRMLAGEKAIDDVPVTRTNAVKAEGEGTDMNSKETRLLDLVKKLDLASSKAEPEATKEGGVEGTDVEQIYGAGENDSDFEEDGGKGHADEEQNYDVAEIGGDESSFEVPPV
ncbi:uncharacterized protein [Branchiostoma lanceolatum]|uniref:uncharacterized protein n=1 Tax=Branchiostoma lanceolatum TaxID=7740 RepID=UPI003455707C